MDQINARRIEIGANTPQVTITDYDHAMRNAVARVYPEAQPQICIFHINKNVTLHVKRKWDKKAADEVAAAQASRDENVDADADADVDSDDEDTQAIVKLLNRLAARVDEDEDVGPVPETIEHSKHGIYKLWEHILYARTLDGFNESYEKLKAFFPQQTAILKYLEETYMCVVQQWAMCYTNKRLNFGHRTTSPVEAANKYLKSFIVYGNRDVHHVVQQSFNMVKAMKQNIKEAR
jgi:predicted  nucleic acid-binding Zn-ribbon protein